MLLYVNGRLVSSQLCNRDTQYSMLSHQITRTMTWRRTQWKSIATHHCGRSIRIATCTKRRRFLVQNWYDSSSTLCVRNIPIGTSCARRSEAYEGRWRQCTTPRSWRGEIRASFNHPRTVAPQQYRHSEFWGRVIDNPFLAQPSLPRKNPALPFVELSRDV